MAIDVFSSGEEIIWQGKTLEVSSLSVSHGYNPVPKAVSPGSQTFYSVDAKVRYTPEVGGTFPSPFIGVFPHRGDPAILRMWQKRPIEHGGNQRIEVKLLVDSVEFSDSEMSLKLIQAADAFSNHINTDPLYHWRNQYYGNFLGEKYKFFGKDDEKRKISPSPLWVVFYACRAAGYHAVPPAPPTIRLDMPCQWSTWTNQWDNPHYVNDPILLGRMLTQGRTDLMEVASDIGAASPTPGVNGIGFSGATVRSSHEVRKPGNISIYSPAMFHGGGLTWVCGGNVTVAMTDPYNHADNPVKFSDIFASFMMKFSTGWQDVPADNLYQFKVATLAQRSIALRWNKNREFILFAEEYDSASPDAKSTRYVELKKFTLPADADLEEVTVTLRQNGSNIFVKIGEVYDSGSIAMPWNLNLPGKNGPAWCEFWCHNPTSTYSIGLTGAQVSVIPDQEPYRSMFQEYVKDYHLFKPTARIYFSSRSWVGDVLPSFRDRTVGQVLEDAAEALAYSWFIGDDNVLQFMPLENTVNPDYPTRRKIVIDPANDIGSYSISQNLTNARSTISMDYAAFAISQSVKTTLNVWKGGGTLAKGDRKEDFVSPPEEEDWLDPDFTLEDQGTHGFEWLWDNNGSFYGGCTVLKHEIKDVSKVAGPAQWEQRMAAYVTCRTDVLSPWTIKLSQKAVEVGAVGSEGQYVRTVADKDISLRTATHDYRGGPTASGVNNPAAHGFPPPDIELPVIRARGILRRQKRKTTIGGGVKGAGTLEIAGWDFHPNKASAGNTLREYEKYLLDPHPNFGSVTVRYDLRYKLGTIAELRGMHPSGRENLFGAIVTAVVCGVSHKPESNQTELTLWVFRADRTVRTWAEVEKNNELAGKTWEQEEASRERQRITWEQVEKNPDL